MFVLASNHFRKYFSVNAGVWLRMENGFSGKEFQLTVKLRPLTRKIFSAKILPSNHFRRHAKRERERDCKPKKPKIVTPLARSSNPRSSNPKNPRLSNLRSSHCKPTNRELHCADRTNESHREPTNCESHLGDRTSIWPDLMIFFLWFCFFCVVDWEMILYICLEAEKMWENVSNK